MQVTYQRARLISAWLSMSFFMAVAGNLQAQPVAQRVLDRIVIEKSDFTGVIKVLFRLPVRYISHTKNKSGTEIVMTVKVIQNSLSRGRPSFGNNSFQNDINSAKNNIRESVVPETKENFGLQEVVYETSVGGEYVSFYFDKGVSFEVIQDSSFRSVNVLIHDVTK